MGKSKDDSIKNLGDKLREMSLNSRKGLQATTAIPTIAELIAEGNALLEQEAKNPQPKKKTSNKSPAASKKNPYLQARLNVLNAYLEWRRNEVAKMEKEGDVENRFYRDFLKSVQEEGDKLS